MKDVMHIELVKSVERGVTKNGWLESKHSFSFGGYTNLKRLNFGALRVLNEDTVEPGQGFGQHRHDNMEIVTIMLSGTLRHKDTLGNTGVLKSGDVQRMSAGSGIEHSEVNASKKEKARLLQIWIFPQERDLSPSYEQKSFTKESLKNVLYPIVSGTHRENSLYIHQDVTFYLGRLDAQFKTKHVFRSKNMGAYLFVIKGQVSVEDKVLNEGDAAQIFQSDGVEVRALQQAEVLLIEVNASTLL